MREIDRSPFRFYMDQIPLRDGIEIPADDRSNVFHDLVQLLQGSGKIQMISGLGQRMPAGRQCCIGQTVSEFPGHDDGRHVVALEILAQGIQQGAQFVPVDRLGTGLGNGAGRRQYCTNGLAQSAGFHAQAIEGVLIKRLAGPQRILQDSGLLLHGHRAEVAGLATQTVQGRFQVREGRVRTEFQWLRGFGKGLQQPLVERQLPPSRLWIVAVSMPSSEGHGLSAPVCADSSSPADEAGAAALRSVTGSGVPRQTSTSRRRVLTSSTGLVRKSVMPADRARARSTLAAKTSAKSA